MTVSPDPRRIVPPPSLGWSRIFIYALPTMGLGYMYLVLLLYFLKFSTDVLLIAPAAMGTVFGLSRVWDALLDPMVGYWSDRTQTRWGRRRPWMAAASLPIALLFLMLWSPPSGLGSNATLVWTGVVIFSFYTSTAAFFIPHQALAAEIGTNPHDRTRLFGARHVSIGIGTAGAVVGITWLNASVDPRASAIRLALVAGIGTAAMILFAVRYLPERPDYKGRGSDSPLRAIADVWHNPHARILLFVFLISSMGGAMLAVLSPYVVEYVLGDKQLLPLFFLFYFLPAYLLVPLWVPLSLRFGRKRLWLFALVTSAVGYGGFLFADRMSFAMTCGMIVLVGIGGGCGQVVGPSVQTDVIDYDEFRTGQRKEGSYFAAWNIAFKSAGGISFMLAGWGLELCGFEPNVEQTESVRHGIMALFGFFPCVCFGVAALILSRFRLTDREHKRIRDMIDQRSAER